jgi:Ni,Fe-hydrogenase I small subunit
MPLTEGVSEQAEKQRRVFFWFTCSALGGVCAREHQQSAKAVASEVFEIAEEMTKYWLEHYGVEAASE